MAQDKQSKLESITKMMRQGKSTHDIIFDNEKNMRPLVTAKAIDDFAYCIAKYPAKQYPLGFYTAMLGSCVLSAEKPTTNEYKSIAGLFTTLIEHAEKFSDRGIIKLLSRFKRIFGDDIWDQLPSPDKSMSLSLHLFQLSLKKANSEIYQHLFKLAQFQHQETTMVTPLLAQANNSQLAFLVGQDRRRTLDPGVMHGLILAALGHKTDDLDIYVIRIVKQYGSPDYNDHHLEQWCDQRFAMITAMIQCGQFLPGLANILMPPAKYNRYQQFAKLIAAQHPNYFEKNIERLREHARIFWGADEDKFLELFAPPDIDDQLYAIIRVIDTPAQLHSSLSEQGHILASQLARVPDGFSVDQQVAKQNIARIAANPNLKRQLAKKLDAGFTPLMALIMHGASDTACQMVQHYDKRGLLAVDASGNTAFHLAAFYRDNKVIKALFKRAAQLELGAEVVLANKNGRGFSVKQCYWAEPSVHLKAPYQHARVVHLRDVTLDRSTSVNRKILNFQELKIFDLYLLADLMLNNNAKYPYPLQDCVLRRGPKPSRNRYIPKLKDDQQVELDLTKQQFTDFTPPQNNQQIEVYRSDEQTVLDAFWRTEYGSYLQQNFFSKIVKFGAKQKDTLQKHIGEVRSECEAIIKEQLNGMSQEVDDNTLLDINNALRLKLVQVMDREWVKEPANKVAQFFARLGKVLLAAMMLFIPLFIPQYRHFLADTRQEHLLRKIDSGMKMFTQNNLLTQRS